MRYLFVILIVLGAVAAATAQDKPRDKTSNRDTINKFDINVPITSDIDPALKESPAAMASGLSGGGMVTVALRIQPDGTASDIQVLQGSDATTNQMVKDMLASKSFVPNVQNDRSTSCLVVFSVPVGSQ